MWQYSSYACFCHNSLAAVLEVADVLVRRLAPAAFSAFDTSLFRSRTFCAMREAYFVRVGSSLGSVAPSGLCLRKLCSAPSLASSQKTCTSGSGPTRRCLLLLDRRLLQAMSLADRLQLEKLLRASTACDDVLLSVLAVARGPLFKADDSEGKAAAAQPFLLSPSSRCPIGLCREEMQEDQKYAQPARPAPCQSGRPFPAASILKTCFPCRQATWGR